MVAQRSRTHGPTTPEARSVRRAGVGLLAWLLAAVMCSVLVSPAANADTAPPAPDAGPATVSADPLPTVQINGIVWAQAVAGTKVFAGGQFTSARPAGSAAGVNETPRSNLLAYNVTTGALDTSFKPTLNGKVLGASVSPDGKRLYISGTFTTVNGISRYRLAAFDTSTGALISNWAPGTNSTVVDIKATSTTVYIAGEFSNVSNTARTGFAALSATTGALLPFNPVMTGGYGGRAVEVSPDGTKVVVAGSFLTTNGSDKPGRGMAALNAQTGASLPWAVNNIIRNAGTNSAIYSLSSDGDSVYGSGYDFGGTKTQDDFEGTFRASWSDGTMQWMEDCHGDTYSVYPFQGAVYTAAHTHYCGNIGEFPQLDPWYLTHSLSFDKQPSSRTITPDIWGYRSFTGNPAGKLLHWYPIWGTGTASGVGQAAWDVTANSDYLLYGGEFTSINGVRQQGLVRFAKSAIAPNKIGPTIQGGQWALTATSFKAGEARLNWRANYDADNAELTYEVFRRNVAAPLYSVKATSTYWKRSIMSFSDKTAVGGQTYEYRVRATDPFGNSTQSDWTPVTVSATSAGNAYNAKVLQDNPKYYWPLNEASGLNAFDWATGNDMTVTSNATRGVTGQAQGQASSATTFTGSNSLGVTSVSEVGPQQLSVEAWFKTSSTAGGKIVGFGSSNSATTLSSSYDRHLYLSGTGRITFGVYPGAVRAISSNVGYNDNKWHHAVGTLSTAGQTLYVDGVSVGTRTDTTSAQSYTGYWRVGGDGVGSWPNAGAAYLAGTIGDVAVYDTALTRQQVNSHWVASGRPSTIPAAPNVLPVASFEATPVALKLSVDASASSDSDGTLSSYAWSFGDGGSATGVTAVHTYASAGTYSVKLTVIDDRGGSSTTTKSVTVTAAKVAPVASFSTSTGPDGMTVSVDASASSDQDGTIQTYAWAFGDGQSATGVNATNKYVSAGQYVVKLTVTDNDGLSNTVEKSVTVAPPVTDLASDTFERTVTGAWGNADQGGAWTVLGGAAAFGVNNGKGVVTLKPADTREARLSAVSSSSAGVQVAFGSNAASSGGTVSVTVIGRQVASSVYSARVRLEPAGTVRLYVMRDEVALGTYVLPTTYQPNQVLRVRVEVTGTSPTTVRSKVWVDGTSEPATWQAQGTDSTASMQVPGVVGIRSAVSSASTVPSTVLTFDDFRVTPVQ